MASARSRRVNLPGAAELFRPTTSPAPQAPPPGPPPDEGPPTEPGPPQPRRGARKARTSGRQRHDEKITVYISAEELLDLEHTRLTLRGSYGIAVDRGRIVREAVAELLADFEASGESSLLIRRLREEQPATGASSESLF
ncbi:MAG: hypothetical protein GEV11_09905 [Streptosporangiales bacterium]|nr:hypothetical protein [Streptosporangiales bacterium]